MQTPDTRGEARQTEAVFRIAEADLPFAGGPVLNMADVTIGSLRNPERVAFEAVNWSAAAGDFWAIGGLHSSGKSDFMAVAAGLMPPLRGSYQVFGHEFITGFERDLLPTRLRLGMVFDGGQLLRNLTVAENIALPIRYHHDLSMEEAAEAVDPLLEITGLSAWADQPASIVSRNWQQRVGLARALALKPQVLFLDSPLAGLDPRDVAWWLDFLAQLAAGHPFLDGRAMTLVVSGDDLRPWQSRARQFAVLRGKQFIPLPCEPHPPVLDDLLNDLLGSRSS